MTVSPLSSLANCNCPGMASMPQDLQQRSTSKTPIRVCLNYELVRGTESLMLGSLLPRIREHAVSLDLSSVARIDAAGIAALISIYCTAVQSGTSFSIVAASPRVLDLLHVVGLDSILLASTGAAARTDDRSAA